MTSPSDAMRTITDIKQLANAYLLRQLVADLYRDNGSQLIIDMYQARTGEKITRTLVSSTAGHMGIKMTAVARARVASARSARTNRRRGKRSGVAEHHLARDFLRIPAPTDTIGTRYYGQ